MAAYNSDRRPSSNPPVIANFDSSHLTISAGVAIFHLATLRVVVCYHSTERYWFLPKGRRDAGEDSGTGAEREGFEEVYTSLHNHHTIHSLIAEVTVVGLPKSPPPHSHPSPAAASTQPQHHCLALCDRACMDAAHARQPLGAVYPFLVYR